MARLARYEFIIGELRKNAAERLRVSVHEFNGHDMLSVRVYVGQDVGQAKPTPEGHHCQRGHPSEADLSSAGSQGESRGASLVTMNRAGQTAGRPQLV
jgi:hypothetical protein